MTPLSLSLSLRPQGGDTPLHDLCKNEKATDEMLRYVGGLWPDAAKEKDDVRATLAARESAPSRRVMPLSLSLRPQFGSTPLHCLCGNEKATDEMLRYVGGLWPDAAKEKDRLVRATLAAPGERALATRDASLSLSLRPQIYGRTPLHLLCVNEKATDEMLRYVGGLWPGAAKEKDKVRA